MANSEEIKKAMASGRAIMGSKSVIDHLKKGKLEMAFLASNCSAEVKEDLVHYAKLAGANIVLTDIPRDEFGIVCKKPFPISVLGLRK